MRADILDALEMGYDADLFPADQYLCNACYTLGIKHVHRGGTPCGICGMYRCALQLAPSSDPALVKVYVCQGCAEVVEKLENLVMLKRREELEGARSRLKAMRSQLWRVSARVARLEDRRNEDVERNADQNSFALVSIAFPSGRCAG